MAGISFSDDDDDAPLLPKRKLPDGELDITPMIDVTFLLLIFFMVCSKMQPNDQLDLPVAHYGVGVETNHAAHIKLLLDKTLPNAPVKILIRVADKDKTKDQATDIAGVRRYVADEVKKGHRQVLIKAERFVPHGTVQQVARAVREVDGAQFYIAVQE